MNTKNQFAVHTTITLGLLLVLGLAQPGLAQTATSPLTIFKNYFVTGDYVVAGWVEQSSNGTYATGTITVPDPKQQPYLQPGVKSEVPVGADVVAAYLYWGTVEGNQSTFAGQQAFFNGYAVAGDILGNPNAPVSWSSGGCSGAANGSKTMRTYRADVRPYLPVDTDPNSPTFGAYLPNKSFQVKLVDSGSNGNTTPNALGATLVIIYRVLHPTTPLNAVVLYDGAYAPNNSAQTMSLTMDGFYEPSLNLTARITHIVANGQPNKDEIVSFGKNNAVLPSLYTSIYGQNAPPFPGIYNGMWDNPTWSVGDFMTGGIPPSLFDTTETTSVVPTSTNSGCVSWGAVVLSTTVQDSDGDGLLDVWETKDAQGRQGYTDAVSGNYVALPGADPNTKDIFVELDYLVNYNPDGTVQHSHLPKQAALDAVGDAFAKPEHPINIHFDVGNVYQGTGDPYIISNPPGTGGNAVSEGAVLCTDGATLCEFPGQPAIGWKGGLVSFQNDATLGNFQPGRSQSYHYILSGHSLGAPRSFWSAYGSALADPDISQLVSIVNSGNTATVTLQTPQSLSPQGVTLIAKPGDCPNALIVGCSDANAGRVTIVGALGQPSPATNVASPQNLNGTYLFGNARSSTTNNVTTTTFTITTAGVPDGTYNFANEPQLGVAYLGPTSTSGHSDFGGGGDSAVTLGLWRADNVSGCQANPSTTLAPGQVYCDDQVGTLQVQIGTLLHELGHSLSLTHGGTYYEDSNNLSLPTYELNCKPNFVSVMNYLFQVRGFSDGGFDYSGQTLQPLNETTSVVGEIPSLSETLGIGHDLFTTATSAHPTRWYSQPNALDMQIQNATGGRYARSHCDGTPLTSADVPEVRVDGALGANSAPLDWNNDLITGDAISAPGIDINYDGLIGDPPFSGFDDWSALNLQQIGARVSAFGFSAAGGLQTRAGGLQTRAGGIDDDGGGLQTRAGGLQTRAGGLQTRAGGIDQDETTATSTQTPPTGLTCTQSVASGKTTYPGCTWGTTTQGWVITKAVPLTWNSPAFGQIRAYNIYRATNISGSVLPNANQFSKVQTLTPIAPSVTPPMNWVDTAVKNNNTYTYFVTAVNKQGVQSGASNFVTVTITTK